MRLLSFFIAFIVLLPFGYGQTKGLKAGAATHTDTSAIDFNRRIALVIGNENYQQDKLINPVNDAEKMAEVLKRYGFRVIEKNNLNRRELNNVINDFGDSITVKKGVSFFYYSGHGLQYNAENYILPVDCHIEKEKDIEDEAVRLNKVFEQMKKTSNGVNFVILDACRSNVFYNIFPSLPKGLTDKEKLPENTSIFFATTPGDIALDGMGNNSPFTESLTRAIRDSIRFYDVARQVIREVKNKTNKIQQPVLNGSPEDEFYFTPKKEGSTLYLLSIGISEYKKSKFMNLQFAGKDAQDVTTAFQQQNGIFYDRVSSWLLTDSLATRFQIMKSIEAIKKQAHPGDIVMMFFAGINDYDLKSDASYFIPVDGDIDHLAETAVDYELVRSLLADLPCQSVLFLDGSYARMTALQLSQTENGVAVFASTFPNQYSFEDARWQNGLFAKALVEGIRGAADTRVNGFVDLRSLGYWLDERVRKLSENRQRPQYFLPAGLANFKISKTIDRKVDDGQLPTIMTIKIK